MQFIFGDDWNDAPRSSRFCSFALESRPLIFVYLHTRTQSIQKQTVEYDKVGKSRTWKTFSEEILFRAQVAQDYKSFLVLMTRVRQT